MQGVIRFPRHHLAHCEDSECRCGICEGGLALCTTCGGAEGSLPTDCPGERMHELVENEVYAGNLDYRRRQGWVRLSSNQWKSWA